MLNIQFRPRFAFAAICLAVLTALVPSAQAAPPDLTETGVIATIDRSGTYNLGPTGLRGWIYVGDNGHGNRSFGWDGIQTGESRQILVTVASSPASAVLAVDDVILGATAGSGSVPAFTSDARKTFGVAIGNAEKNNPAILRVKRWRAGVTTDVEILMTTMGDYTATAPYNCPKSALILANARIKLVGELLADPNFLTSDWKGAINGLALLAGVASGDANYAAVQIRLQTYARGLAGRTLESSDVPMWDWGYIGLFLSEYYLSTADAQVVTGITNQTVALAKAQSRFGTYGHHESLLKADGSLHGAYPPYGPVNMAGLPANLAIVMGKKALLAAGQAIDPEIDPAIQRGSDFFAYFVNKGGIPYGESEPNYLNHGSNGKDPMCAMFFALQTGRTVETEFFTRLAIAGFNGRELGHSGQGFSYLWGAMGANIGGSLAAAEFLKPVRWHLDLSRRTDGSFAYDGAEQYGAGSTADGTYLGACGYHDSNPTAAYILNYSLPLQRLYITGKNANPANTLDATKLTNAVAAGSFYQDCQGFTTTQLIAALSEFDPIVRNDAAVEVATRTLNTPEVNTLLAMLTGTNANGRMGAGQALGSLKNTASLPLLRDLLSDPELWVRAKAASAIVAIQSSDSAAVSAYRDSMLTTYVANSTDPDVIDWRDPIQNAHSYLSFALFGGWDGDEQIAAPFYTISAPKSLLYPAVKAGLKQPGALPRYGVASFSNDFLSLPDVQALIPDLIEVVEVTSQADAMFSSGPRKAGINTLAKHQIAEAIPLALLLQELPQGPAGWFGEPYQKAALEVLATYGDAARWTLPTLRNALTTRDPASGNFATLVNTIASIENAITAPTLVPGYAVANSQVVSTTGAQAITLTGTSPRDAVVTFTNVTAPAHGTLIGAAPNLIYTPTGAYTGPDSFTFRTTDTLTTSEPGTVSIIVGTAGTGLKGEYYDNMDFTNLKLTRTDAQVNFDWGTGTPNALLGADTFSVRWNGLLLVPETGTYTFSTLNSGGVNLYIDGVQVIDNSTDQSTHWKDSSSINLTAGQKVELQMEYFENTGSAVAKLKWTGPSFAGDNGVLIGTEWLYDATGVNRPAYAHAQSVTLVQNTPLPILLQGSGVISSPLTYSVVTPPSQGALRGIAPNLTYTPATNFSGSDSFTFIVNNGTGNSAPATVSIGIWAGLPVSYTWLAATSGNLNLAGNWVSGTAPAASGQPYYNLDFTPSGTYTVTHNLNNGFQLNQLNMGGAVTLAGTNSLVFTGNGPLLPQFNQNSADPVTINTPLNLNATTTFGGTGTGWVSISSPVSGTGGLTKNGYGTLALSGANTYFGGTVINSGTLRAYPQLNSALGSGTITLNGGTLYLEFHNLTNALIVNGGKIFAENAFGSVMAGPTTLSGNLTLENPAYNTVELAGNISGPGGLVIKGRSVDRPAGTFILSGSNSYTGPTSVTSGTLICTLPTSLGTGALSMGRDSRVTLNFTGTRNISALSLSGTAMAAGTYGSTGSPAIYKNDTYFSVTGTGTVTVGGANVAPVADAQNLSTEKNTAIPITLAGSDVNQDPLSFTIVTQPTSGSLISSGANVTYTPAANFLGADSFTFKANDGALNSAPATVSINVTPPNYTWNSAVSGNWSDVTKWLAGSPESSGDDFDVLNFNAAGTYTATHDLNEGFLLNQLNFGGSTLTLAGNSLAFVANGATLPTINQNSGAEVLIPANFNLGSDTTFAGSGSGKVTASGVVSGSGGLTKSTSGTLQLYGLVPNTYTGGTTVNSGTLHLGAIIETGSPAVINPLGTGTVTLNGSSTLYLERVSASNALVLNGGTLHSQNGWGATWSGPITLNTTLICNARYQLTCSNSISGTGGLVKTDNGPLILSGTSSYSGNTTVNGGILQLNAANTGNNASTVTLAASGATLNLNFAGTDTVNQLFIGTTQMAAGVYKAAGSAAAGTPISQITGTGTLTVSAGGTGETTPPTLLGSAIVDNKSGGPVVVNTVVTYAVTFSEDMDASTVTAADFGNAGSSVVTIGAVTETTPGVFTVLATPTSAGTLQLQVNAAAVLTDVAGNALVTTAAIADNTIITVSAAVLTPPVSGYSRWFDASQITDKANGDPVTTWNDLSGNAAHATVPSGNAAPVYVANAGTETGLPAVYFSKNTGASDSAALSFTRDSDIRTVFSVFKGNSFLLTDAVAYDFHRPGNDVPADWLWDSYASDKIRNGLTYVNGNLVTGTTYAMPTNLHNGFNLVEVIITSGTVQADSFNKDRTFHAGNQYQAEVIIYDRVLTGEERKSVEIYLMKKWMAFGIPQADILTFGPGATIGQVVANSSAISWTLPYGTDVTAIAPTYTLSAGASCVPASGSTQNFTNPVQYVVTASDNTTKNYAATVAIRPIADPKFTLTAPANWDGRQTITVQANITNQALLSATGGTNVNYNWNVDGVATTQQITPGVLTLTRSHGSGPMSVTLTMDNGGFAVSHSVTVNVQAPASDPWLQRTPGANEKPVIGQFFARDPGTGLGTIYYSGTQSDSPAGVFLKVYTTDTGDVLYATHRQSLVGNTYAFTAPILAGKKTYKVVYGTTNGSNVDTVVATVTNLLCGDAYIIDGQSNAEATNNGAPDDSTTDPWVRTYAQALGWGYANSKGGEMKIGMWGMVLAKRIVADHQIPVCFLNGAVGGTQIDQHQANPVNHTVGGGGMYSIYADLLNRVIGANLTHGIRGVFWHQGESDCSNFGPNSDWDYTSYQRLFVDMSAAWKQDYPNLQRYIIYQVMPKPCGIGPKGDQLREVQRNLPRLYSKMNILNTLGLAGYDGCHFSAAGYANIANRTMPLVSQDFYGVVTGASVTAPNLRRAYFATSARTAVALEFDQAMNWSNFSLPNYYLDKVGGKVTSGSASGNVVTLQLSSAAAATATIDYLQDTPWNQQETVSTLLYGANAIPALTFADVSIRVLAPYESWSGTKNLSGAAGAGDADPDQDGVKNVIEYVLGGEPNPSAAGSNSVALLPVCTRDGAGGLVFTFKRKTASVGGVNLAFQWATNLTFPPLNSVSIGAASSAVDGVNVAITSFDTATDTVIITVPTAKAAGGKLFGRLHAEIP